MKTKAMLSCFTAAIALVAAGAHAAQTTPAPKTKTPIKHLVVIFGENRSFDHYFATYPKAQNNAGETKFKASKFTPAVNNLTTPLDVNNNFAPLKHVDLLAENPNGQNGTGGIANGVAASNPFRLSPSNAWTTGNNHSYMPEQQAYDNGAMDKFPAFTGESGDIGNACNASTGAGCEPIGQQITMAYFDGNTVTAWWNLAQNFALNDNMFTTMFGPSTTGAVNLISGQTNGLLAETPSLGASGNVVADGAGNFTDIGDLDPMGDTCSSKTSNMELNGTNVGDLLNAQNISWGWFQGGFDLTVTNPNGTTGCARSTVLVTAPGIGAQSDYVPHHEPFQFFAGTRNLTHARPTNVASVGHTFVPGTTTVDPANHQYDTHDFFDALAANNLPSVTFLKAPSFQDAHPGNSDPLDEQTFIVTVLNALQNSADWESTAVVLTYDDSDGWYDHQMPPIVNPSATVDDALNAPGVCDSSNGFQQDAGKTPKKALQGSFGNGPVQGRCGYGTRLPFLVVSPFAKVNFVDHTLLDQSSVTAFIEDNWLSGQRLPGSFDKMAGKLDNLFDFTEILAPKVFLNPKTGEVTSTSAP